MTTAATTSDIVIVGGGPAGIAAAIWCSDLGLDAVLLESSPEIGGQLSRIYNPIINYPGVATANGSELRDRFVDSLNNFSIVSHTGVSISKVDAAARKVASENGSVFAGRVLMIATGVSRRALGVPGERELKSKGIISSGAGERESVAGKRVVIVGGGDAAIENALILSGFASSVTVIHRRSDFTARPQLLDEARKRANVEFVTEAAITRIVGSLAVEGVEIAAVNGGERTMIAADNVLIRIGVEPNTELIRGQVEVDKNGYAVVDRDWMTSVEGVYCIGDAACGAAPTISTAVGSAATAVKAAHRLLRN